MLEHKLFLLNLQVVISIRKLTIRQNINVIIFLENIYNVLFIFKTAHVHDAHAHAGHDAVLHQQQAVNGYSVAAPVVDHHHHQHQQPISNGYAVDNHQHQQQAVDGYAVGHDFHQKRNTGNFAKIMIRLGKYDV